MDGGAKPTNLSTCCRLCLNEEHTKSVFEVGDSFQTRIHSSLGLEIQVGDRLSTAVCNHCIERINTWQTYKLKCAENQDRLEQWLTLSQSQSFGDISIQIKDEPIDTDFMESGDVQINLTTDPVKNEPSFDELPPRLTPQTLDPLQPEEEPQLPPDEEYNSSKCYTCKKILSCSSNRRKHEKNMHGYIHALHEANLNRSSSNDDTSQTSTISQPTPDVSKSQQPNQIAFAAGLKLLRTPAKPTLAVPPPDKLTPLEVSFLAKCKAMHSMLKNLHCVCHGSTMTSMKTLLTHLRNNPLWFPVYTCFHCMIRSCDRSSCTRHMMRCQRPRHEALAALGEQSERTDHKVRLYQNFRCKGCNYLFWYYKDYQRHVAEEHDTRTCLCGVEFDSSEAFRQHAYISCYIEHNCDICNKAYDTLDSFQDHCIKEHDSSEGYSLEATDTFKPRGSRFVAKKRPLEDPEPEVLPAKRPRHAPKIDYYEEQQQEEKKVINPVATKSTLQRLPGLLCPICNREYSSNANMWRHYQAMHLSANELYACPDCKGMFSAVDWPKHKESHTKKSCTECNKVFQFESELVQHRAVHLNIKLTRDSKTKSYKSQMISPTSVVLMCEVCDQTFRSKEELKAHKFVHESVASTPSKRWECKLCDKVYVAYSGLYDHFKRKHPEMWGPHADYPKVCEHCDKIFNTGTSYLLHMQSHQNHPKVYKKPPKLQLQIKETNESKDFSEEESDDDEDESYHTCKKCFKVFAHKTNLTAHMRSHGISPKKSPKKAWCNVCHSAFDSPQALDKHKAQGHRDEEDEMPNLTIEGDDFKSVFTCDICVETFSTKLGLKRHKEKHAKEKQPRERQVYCKHCKIGFSGAGKLQEHMLDEHDEDADGKKKYNCKLCRKTFPSAISLQSHRGWHKRSGMILEPICNLEEKFNCTSCSASLPNNTALQIHILEKHRNVDTIVVQSLRCVKCNLEFSSQSEHEKHKKYHEIVKQKEAAKQKVFPCGMCPAAFNRADLLKLHLKQFHPEGDKEFKCTECNRVFDKAASLSIHLKVHEKQKMMANGGGTKYSCSICSKGFDLPKDLRTHTIEAHPF